MPPSPTPDAVPTNRRRIIAGMLFVSVVINYLDRSNISIAGPHLAAALRAVGAPDTPVVAVSSIPPPRGIDELADALDAHRAQADVAASRARARRLAALAEFTLEHGESAVRALDGRRAAEKLLAELDPAMPVAELVSELERRLP